MAAFERRGDALRGVYSIGLRMCSPDYVNIKRSFI